MSLETVAQDQAYSAINRCGVTVTLSRVTPGDYDTATGTPATGTTTTCDCYAMRDAASQSSLGYTFGSGLVQTGDEKWLVPARDLSFDPMPGDTITCSTVTGKIIGVQPTYVGASIALYQLLVRR